MRTVLNCALVAKHYREAARLAMSNRGLSYLLDRGLYGHFREAFGFEGGLTERAERSLALCFMAAIVEAGDA